MDIKQLSKCSLLISFRLVLTIVNLLAKSLSLVESGCGGTGCGGGTQAGPQRQMRLGFAKPQLKWFIPLMMLKGY
jgi:hypothetical protein